MTLKQYLKKHGRGALTLLAVKVGTSKGYLHDISKGAVPSVEVAKRIDKATEGEVPAAVTLGIREVAR